MSRDINSYERNPNAKKPIRAFNTNLTRGGDQRKLHPQATTWEGINAAQARMNIDPAQIIADKITSLKSRVSDIGRKTFNVDPKTTRKKIKAVQLLISRFSGDKTGFLAELKDIEQSLNPSN